MQFDPLRLTIWRRRESNPRPKIFNIRLLHVYPFLESCSTVSEKARHYETSPDTVSLTRFRTCLACYPACRRFPNTAGKRRGNGMPTY